MGNVLYSITAILIMVWVVGFLGYHAGGLIHVVLAFAFITLVLRMIQGNSAKTVHHQRY